MSKPLYNPEHHRIAEYISKRIPGINEDTAYGIVEDYAAFAAVERSSSGNRIKRAIIIDSLVCDVGEILLWNGFDGKQAIRTVITKARNIPEDKFVYIDRICRPIFYEDKILDDSATILPTDHVMTSLFERDPSDFDNFNARHPYSHDARKIKRE